MSVEARLWSALREVEDPEIPISVVGMGLIVSLAYLSETRTADVQITYTAMGCPAMEFIEDDIRGALLADRRVTGAGAVWEVFARQAYEEPLHHVGTITEPDEDLALISARAVYDEQPWIQMIIVPRTAIREAISA